MLPNLFITLLACNNQPNQPEEECIDSSRSSEIEEEIVEVTNGDAPFALSLHNEAHAQNKENSKNLVHSPYSISSALGMLHLGASGNTKIELEVGLGIENETVWHNSKGIIIQELHQPQRCDYQLAIANKLFAQKDMPFHDEFINSVDTIYGAPVQEVDFQGSPEEGRIIVNDWVSEQTLSNIPNLLPEGSVTTNTRLILTNAIYMNAPWKQPFDPSDTRDFPFTTADGQNIQVPTMIHSEMDIQRYDDELMSVANIPYEGNELSMSIYLPQEGVALSDIEDSLDTAYLQTIQSNQYFETALINLPKFEIRSKLELKDTLINLGMESMFEGGLDNISNENLVVSSVIHEAWIKVEEKGTEASAATAVMVEATSMPAEEFIVNRAFLFTIQDDITGALLFMGRVDNPLE